MRPADHHREGLPLTRRLALHVDELRGVRHRIEHDDELRGQRERKQCLLAGRQLDHFERDILEHLLEGCLGQVHARAPEDLPVILGGR